MNLCHSTGQHHKLTSAMIVQGPTKVVDTSKLQTMKKRVRGLDRQGDMESRRLWRQVTQALKNGDIDTATEHKRFVSVYTFSAVLNQLPRYMIW
jgi:hypothetical protein